MITLPDKPELTTQTGKGKIELDRVYDFIVTKRSNGKVTYEVEVIGEDICASAAIIVKGAVMNYVQKHPVFG